MKNTRIVQNKGFVGRTFEREKLLSIANAGEAAIIVVYGRRRVGKTELIEQTFASRRLLKFEGRENQPPAVQRQIFLESLADYIGDRALAKLGATSWRAVLEILAERTKTGEWTLFFEEFQWLCCYEPELVSELKYSWDNHLRHNPKLLLVLCGSSPSFMLREVVYSKALHNRSQHEIALQPFSLAETRAFLGPRFPVSEVLKAHLAVGGIPEYLKYIRAERATIPALAKHSFLPESFFGTEKKTRLCQRLVWLATLRSAHRCAVAGEIRSQSSNAKTGVRSEWRQYHQSHRRS